MKIQVGQNPLPPAADAQALLKPILSPTSMSYKDALVNTDGDVCGNRGC